MKTAKGKRLALALTIGLFFPFLVSCGSGSPDDVGNHGDAWNADQSGLFDPNTMGSGDCIPVNMQIPFTATNVYLGSSNLIGGQIPRTEVSLFGYNTGQVTLGGGGAGGYYQNTGINGTISMNLSPTTGGNAAQSGPANGSGYIQLSGSAQEPIRLHVQANPQIFGSEAACISGVAFNLGQVQGRIYGGFAYLYLNRTQRHARVPFFYFQ